MLGLKNNTYQSFILILLLSFASTNAFGKPDQSVSPYEHASHDTPHQHLKPVSAKTQAAEDAASATCLDCFSWDIDASGEAEPLTDGLIILRYLIRV